jgi:hypothetical protein
VLIHAVVVGIAEPRAVTVDGQTVQLEPLVGVDSDVAAYRELVEGVASTAATVAVECITDVDDLSATEVLSRIVKHTEQCDCDCLVVALIGHGVQSRTSDPTEPDRLDECFVTSRGLITDNQLGRVWDAARPTMHIVVFTDACHSQSLGRRNLIDDLDDQDALNTLISSAVLRTTSPGPSRVFLAATPDDAVARATDADGVPSGIFTSALMSVWRSVPKPRDYVEWHRAVALQMYPMSGQLPTLQCDGVDDRAMYSAPLGGVDLNGAKR